MEKHDLRPGPLSACQISGSEDLHLCMDLGHQPPCAALLDEQSMRLPQLSYPLRLYHCPESGGAQLDYVVAGEELYPPTYPYRAGISKPVIEAQAALAAGLEARFGPLAGKLVVDIGSNDGVLLAALQRNHGAHVVGVEPTNVAVIANEAGVPTVQAFFSPSIAEMIVDDHGRADLVTMTHVFAHMAPLGTVMRGVLALLKRPGGVLVIENHYLLALQERNQFDSIYHEHLRTYSLKALCSLFSQYGLEVFDAERADRYGGNIRAYVAAAGERNVEPSVRKLLMEEVRAGLHQPTSWTAFRSRVFEQRDRFMEFMYGVKRKGHSIAGYSAPGRATPLINFYGLTPQMIPYIGELPDSLKLDKYTPGTGIPIIHNGRLFREQPEYVVVFAWHYVDFIQKRLRAEGLRSKLVVPLPEFHVLE